MLNLRTGNVGFDVLIADYNHLYINHNIGITQNLLH